MTYSARQAINLHVKNIPHDIRAAFEERAARAIIFHGGNEVVRKYKTEHWAAIVTQAKQDLQGHFEAEVIRDAEFEIR